MDFVATNCYHVAIMTEVSVRQLKDHLSQYLRRLEQGEEFTVTRRGKAVAIIAPIGDEGRLRRKLLELRERGIIHWSGEKARIPKRGVKLIGEGPSAAQMVLEDRR